MLEKTVEMDYKTSSPLRWEDLVCRWLNILQRAIQGIPEFGHVRYVRTIHSLQVGMEGGDRAVYQDLVDLGRYSGDECIIPCKTQKVAETCEVFSDRKFGSDILACCPRRILTDEHDRNGR